MFWGVLFGLPIIGYKAVSTLDSMIGHRARGTEAFGWARRARIANFIGASYRFLFALFAGVSGLRCPACGPTRDIARADWPEAAMAAALGVRLAALVSWRHRDELAQRNRAAAAGDITRTGLSMSVAVLLAMMAFI